MDLEKRLSDPRASTGNNSNNTPQIQVPPPPGSKLAPLPLPPPSKSSPSQPQLHTPTSISAGLQSPRLSYIPVSPIDAAFRDDIDKRFNGGGGGGGGDAAAAAAAAASGLGIGIGVARSLSSRSVKNGNGSNNDRTISSFDHQLREEDPVSPIDDDDDDDEHDDDADEENADSKRVSFVSAPSVAGDHDGDPDLVSPLSPNTNRRSGTEEVPVSPVTVSPVESRRGSVTDR